MLNAYTQFGQALPHTEDRLRALAFSYRREKALSHLVEMTTDTDPEEEENEASIVDAQAGALAEGKARPKLAQPMNNLLRLCQLMRLIPTRR